MSVREPQISPDGTRVVYVRAVPDFAANRDRTELVLVDVATKARHVLTQNRGGVANPTWSPDGKSIAFTAAPAVGEAPEAFVLSLSGGDALQVTHAKGVGGIAWRPDGRALAYIAGDPSPAPAASASPSAPAASASPTASAAPSPSPTPKGYVEAFTVTDEHYLTRAPEKPQHLWTIATDGGTAHQLTKGAASYSGRISWTPDGKSIAIVEQPDAVFAHFTKAGTVLVDTTTGAVRPLRKAGGPDSGAVLSPDGIHAAISVPRHGTLYLQGDVVVRNVADGKDVLTTQAIDRNAHWYDWLDNRTVLVGAADGVRQYVWRAALDGSAPVRLDAGDVDVVPDATVARDGTIAFVGTRPERPGEIYVTRRSGPAVAITDENAWIGKHVLGRTERLDWTSDGMAVNGALTYPPDYVAGKQYPLVLVIHGGPVATSYRTFSTLPQMLAAHGYLVLQPNYRGSDNSGDAFLQAIVGPVTSGPGRDNLAGVEAVKKLGIVDPARIGVSGWSGGGLQTSWLIGHASFWRAALSGAAVNDWFEQATLADINEEFATVFLGGVTPWTAKGREIYRAESPITFAANVKTPTLIMTDAMDQRVPITQSFAFYRALQAHHVPVRLVELPRFGHNPSDPMGREARVRIWTEWFDRWMK